MSRLALIILIVTLGAAVVYFTLDMDKASEERGESTDVASGPDTQEVSQTQNKTVHKTLETADEGAPSAPGEDKAEKAQELLAVALEAYEKNDGKNRDQPKRQEPGFGVP